jgi:hypothetical protein
MSNVITQDAQRQPDQFRRILLCDHETHRSRNPVSIRRTRSASPNSQRTRTTLPASGAPSLPGPATTWSCRGGPSCGVTSAGEASRKVPTSVASGGTLGSEGPREQRAAFKE